MWVLIDEKLKFHKHVCEAVSTANQTLETLDE